MRKGTFDDGKEICWAKKDLSLDPRWDGYHFYGISTGRGKDLAGSKVELCEAVPCAGANEGADDHGSGVMGKV